MNSEELLTYVESLQIKLFECYEEAAEAIIPITGQDAGRFSVAHCNNGEVLVHPVESNDPELQITLKHYELREVTQYQWMEVS